MWPWTFSDTAVYDSSGENRLAVPKTRAKAAAVNPPVRWNFNYVCFPRPLLWILTIFCRCEGTPRCELWPPGVGQRAGLLRQWWCCCCCCCHWAGSRPQRHRGPPPPLLLHRHSRRPPLLLLLWLWQQSSWPAALPPSVPPRGFPGPAGTAPLCCAAAPSPGGPRVASGPRPVWAALQERSGLPAQGSNVTVCTTEHNISHWATSALLILGLFSNCNKICFKHGHLNWFNHLQLAGLFSFS